MSSLALFESILPFLAPISSFVKTALDYNIQKRNQQFQTQNFALSYEQKERHHAEALEFQQNLFENQKHLQWDLVVRQFEQQLELADRQFEHTLLHEEYKRILDDHVLRILPTPLRATYRQLHNAGSPLPLLLLLSPPEIAFDKHSAQSGTLPSLEKSLEENMRVTLRNYSQDCKRVNFFGGAWESKRWHGETAVQWLHWMYSPIPTLVLESEFDDEFFNLHAAFWWPGQEASPACMSIISELPYTKVLRQIAKLDALRWRREREQIIPNIPSLDSLKDNEKVAEMNLRLLSEEEQDALAGISRREYEYNFSAEHLREFNRLLITCHSLIVMCLADAYFLTNYRLPPALPRLLPELLQDRNAIDDGDKLLSIIIPAYREVYASLERHIPNWMPELYLQSAMAFAHTSDKTFAKEQLDKSIDKLVELRGGGPSSGQDYRDRLKAVLVASDQPYVENVRDIAVDIGASVERDAAEDLLRYWRELKLNGQLERDAKGETLYGKWI
jgi:hypothetical protein